MDDPERALAMYKNAAASELAYKLMKNLTEKCFQKCITRPGTSLDARDNACITQCVDSFMQTMQVVGNSMNSTE